VPVPMLESHVAGRCYAAPDEGTVLQDAVTGEPVARISSGRAGGGEEFGGMRAVVHFRQRTALRAPPAMLAAVGVGDDR
jgi:hypothetical protein